MRGISTASTRSASACSRKMAPIWWTWGERALAEVERIGNSPEMRGIKMFFLDNQAEGVTESLSELLKAGLIGAAAVADRSVLLPRAMCRPP